jgi:transcriptional regulator with PAS, ATPase and Fis domain
MKTLSCILLFLTIQIFCEVAANAQEVDVFAEKQRNANKILEEKINQLTSESKEANELWRKLVVVCQNSVVFDAVKSSDAAVIKLLELVADNGIARMVVSEHQLKETAWLIELWQLYNCDADVALAKAGNTKYLNRIISQTDASKAHRIREDAVRKLVLIDNNVAYKRLYELLDDTTMPKSEGGDDQELPISESVMYEMEKAVSNPPNLKKVYETIDKINLWKKWFKENKGF